jgi:DNA-binding NtrC family response regulator
LNSNPKRLLFVDDELGIRETMPVILGRHGFTVTVAASVSQAIQEIRKQEFDILLTDLNIENQEDGYVVVQAIREINPNCVTIILTGHPGFDSVVQGIREGVDDYVMKPAAPEALVALLAEKLVERQTNANT